MIKVTKSDIKIDNKRIQTTRNGCITIAPADLYLFVVSIFFFAILVMDFFFRLLHNDLRMCVSRDCF